MGNAGSNSRDRSSKSADTAPPSPTRDEHAFTFDKKAPDKIPLAGSHDEDGPVYTKQRPPLQEDFEFVKRQRSATVSEGTKVDDKVLPTVFKWEGGGKQVFISGTFTNWETLPMVKSHGDFVTIIDLPEGEHEYKFYVDGEWKHDPTMRIAESSSGARNNLITVKRSDFEVFQALANDSEHHSADLQCEYSQIIPVNKPWEKASGPPILPPHLLQVILNKDTPLSCEPTLLPEPNHVMLNHLYALSIKDGVMVLSATHRYRKNVLSDNAVGGDTTFGGPGQAFAHFMEMEEVLDKLKILNYDEEFVKDLKMKSLNRFYFAIPTNPGEQFYLFTSLAVWLIRKCGKKREQPQEYDDPNATISGILEYLREQNVSIDFPPNRLKQGFGENVIHVLNQLTDQAVLYNNVKWQRPEHIPEVEEREMESEDEGELFLEKVEEEMAAVYSDDEEDSILHAEDLRHFRNQQNSSKIHKPDEILESKISNEVWQVELERVLPMLKVSIKTDARDWRHRLEQMTTYKNEIKENLTEIKTLLEKLQDEVSIAVEKISTREKYLNVNLEPLLKLYRTKQDELSNLTVQYKTFNTRTMDKSKTLNEVTEKLENVKKEIEERGSSMTDGTPLVNIKKVIARIRSENKDLNVRTGILENEVLKQKLNDKTRFHLNMSDPTGYIK